MCIIYKITILNWSEYNPKHKKSFKKLMIPNNFAQDAKLNAMPVTHRWMWLVLLLTCSDHASDTIELSERQARAMLESSKSIDSVLDRLQSFQLLRYEKYALKEVKERNIKEEKGIEKKLSAPRKSEQKVSEEKDQNKKIWQAYFDAYRLRYGVDPVRNAIVNSQISGLRKKLGLDDAVEVVKFYLTHNDSFFLKNTHSFGLCLSQAETLRTQMLRNQPITSATVKKFERSMMTYENDRAIEKLFESENPNADGT